MKKVLSFLILILSFTVLFAQEKSITGSVTDEKLVALPGVNVVVKGTTIGAITDIDGNFKIILPSGKEVLQFSFIGFESQEVDVSKTTKINLQLKQSIIGFDEVVVVGYGTQTKVNVTGSVATVEGTEMSKQPVTLSSEALQGISPGVTVSKSSGAPGSSATIKIRGITSFSGTAPLVLIDGIEGDLNTVESDDIESISVLKDAASASIYGSRGANGVILVTTKRAKKNTIEVTYKGWIGVDNFTSLPKYVDGYDYMKLWNMAVHNDNPAASQPYSDKYLAEYLTNYKTDPDHYPNTNWQDITFTGSGVKQNHYLSVSGGTDKLRSLVSVSYLDQKGLVPNNSYKSYTFRSNNDLQVKKWIRFGLDLNGKYSVNNYPSAGLDQIFDQGNRIPAIDAAKFSNGKYGPGFFQTQNPLAYVEASGLTSNKGYTFNGKLSATITPLKGLDISAIYSPNFSFYNQQSFNRTYELYSSPADINPKIVPPQASSINSHSTDWQNNFDALIKYSKSFGDHNLSVLLGYEAIDYHYESLWGQRKGYLFEDYTVLDAGEAVGMQNSGNASEWALLSQFGRLNYDYKRKYLFEANLRRDGSSRFMNDRWSVFPSFSAGWRITEEEFMKKYDWLDNLKLRASWGKLGNQNVGDNYPFMQTVTLNNQYYIFGTSPTVNTGGAVTSLPNANLTWEYTETSNFGVDFSVLKGLISMSAEYYIRNTSDILYTEDVPLLVGLNGPKINAFKVKNSGIDLSLSSFKKFGDFSYEVRVNFDDVKNEVTDLYKKKEWISGNTISKVGFSMWSYYLFDTDGLLQKGETQSLTYAGRTPVAGDIKYVDQLTIDTNGDGIPDARDGKLLADDKVIVGSPIPRYNFSAKINLKYKMFDLSVFFQGVGKQDVLMTGMPAWAFDNSSGNIQTWMTDYWTPENPGASYPNLGLSNRYNYTPSNYWLRDGSYLRLKNIQVGFNVPDIYLKKLDISAIRFFVTGQNLLTFDKMPKGWDPETPNNSSYPILKTISGGLNITF